MNKLSSTQRRVSARGILAGTAFVLLLTTQTSAFAQSEPPITKAMAPKQVGLWTVDGWKRGNVGTHCSAERPLRGAAANGGSLQFALVQFPGGYRIVLGAEDWELKPQTSFPIELSAPPVLQSKGNAVAVGPKVVIIEMGPNAELMKKLTQLPMLEVKAAQTTFNLPLEGASEALAEVEACYASLKKPAENPFAAAAAAAAEPAEASDRPAQGQRAGEPDRDRRAGEGATGRQSHPRRARFAESARRKPVATGPDPELIEERTFLTYKGPNGHLPPRGVRGAARQGRGQASDRADHPRQEPQGRREPGGACRLVCAAGA